MKKDEPYRQYIPTGELSLERNTENVPNDGWFYVVRSGAIVGRFKSFKQAQQEYMALRDTLAPFSPIPETKGTRSNALDQYFLDKELYWAESHRFRGGGGKGGRGGI